MHRQRENRRQLIHAALVADGAGRCFAPGAILLQGRHIVAAGTPMHIGRCDDVYTRNCANMVLLPALVNAHAHLDLTHVASGAPGDDCEIRNPMRLEAAVESAKARVPIRRGERADAADFIDWVQMIRRQRATEPSAIAASVQHGVELSRAGGTALLGDVAGIGSVDAVEALRGAGLAGVSFLEVFGMGRRQPAAIEAMHLKLDGIARDDRGVRLGIQPHAPYSCGLDMYRAAAATGLPMATHLAETLDELEFVASGGGPMRQLLQSIGVWDESIRGAGCHPVELLKDVLSQTPCIAAHLNYIEDGHVEMLADWPVTVAYCPRASAYFGHPGIEHPRHRYRDMLAAGINVALGTDSIVCLDTPDRISVLDDMRLLHRRDGTDPQLLLRMATINGATALGFDAKPFTLAEGESAGLIGIEIDPASNIDPMKQALTNDAAPSWIVSVQRPETVS